LSDTQKPALTPEERARLKEQVRSAGVAFPTRRFVPFRNVEFRDATGTGDGSYTLSGYAAVFNQETILYDGNWWRLREVILPDSFTDVLASNPDVHLNVGHDMIRALARTGIDGIGGLELTQDDVGLRVFARLDPTDPDVVALAAKMNRGIVDQMSFCFTVGRSVTTTEVDEESDFEDELVAIQQFDGLYDVAVCAQGAYATTSAELAMRSLAALGRAGYDLAGLLTRRGLEPGAETPVAPTEADVEPEAAAEPLAPTEALEAPETPQDGDGELEAGGADQRARVLQAMRMRTVCND
jgi:HK97 family phage prohead protease